jgi:hypothetical protein
MVRSLLIALALPAALAGCQVRDPDACSITCNAASGCPEQMTCGADNYCYGASEVVGSCSGAVPDGGSGVCADPCDPVLQCGCDDSEGCYLGGGGGEVSCLESGDRTQDMTCSTDRDCATGYDCVSAGSGGRHCQKYCGDDNDCDGALSLCNREVAGGPTRICTSNCDPMGSDCGGGEDCVLGVGENDRFDANCLVPGPGAYLDSCVDQADCGPGLLCVTTPSVGTFCQLLCEMGGTDCGGGSCGPLDPPALFNATEYGVCD